MAGYSYNKTPKNPFYPEEEDDVDDETFLRSARKGTSGYMLSPEYDKERDLEERRLQLLERKKMIEDRTVQSSQRSIGILRESEQIGVATAEELLKQREQLERTEQRLDDINSTLRTSQKHIQSIKSVFGSLRNYLSGRPNEVMKPHEPVRDTPSGASPLAQRVEDMSFSEKNEYLPDHPGLRVRGLGREEEMQSRPSGKFQDALNENLEEMSGSISRLKGLAMGLGEEIDFQNDLIENISTKADRADVSVNRQNREMKQILKK